MSFWYIRGVFTKIIFNIKFAFVAKVLCLLKKCLIIEKIFHRVYTKWRRWWRPKLLSSSESELILDFISFDNEKISFLSLSLFCSINKKRRCQNYEREKKEIMGYYHKQKNHYFFALYYFLLERDAVELLMLIIIIWGGKANIWMR